METLARRPLPVYQQDGPLGIFKDSDREALFRSAGFVKFTPFTPEEAADLRREAADLMMSAATKSSTSIDLTNAFADPTEKRRVQDWANERVAGRCLACLNDYKLAMSGISRKPPHSDYLQSHVAWTFMKDPKIIGVTAWVALEDVHLDNGAMKFLKGAHGLGWPAWGPAMQMLAMPGLLALEHEMTTVTVKAGEGFLFDSYLPHGSTANTTDHDRLAVRIQMIPQEAEHVLHNVFPAEPSKVYVYPFSDAHLATLSFEQLLTNDVGREPIDSYPRPYLNVTAENFLQAYRHGEAIRSGERDFASFFDPPAEPAPAAASLRQPTPGVARRLRGYAGRIKRGVLRRSNRA